MALHENPDPLDRRGFYGDNPSVKLRNCTRDVFSNINGMPQLPSDAKNRQLLKSFLEVKADAVGLAEINLDWRLIPSEANFYSQTYESPLRPVKAASVANTTSQPLQAAQVGGVATLVLHKLLPRVISVDKDPTNLGRWISMLIEGKGSHRCRLVTGYLPNQDNGSNKKQTKGTVSGQHRKHFQKIKRDKEPRSAWIADFTKEVRA